MDGGALAKIKVLAESFVPQEEGKAPPAAPGEEQPGWVSYVAVLTGILAALAGFLTVRATSLTNDAIYESNQAVLAQTEASDAWGEYQADSVKARVVEMQLLPSSPVSAKDRKKLQEEYDELRARQPQIKAGAQEKMAQRQDHLTKSMSRLGQKDLLGYAGMASQLAIALASVAAITRRKQAFYAGIVIGVASVLITAYAFAATLLMGMK